MPAAYDYGTLLTAQSRGSFRGQSIGAQVADAAVGNTQNWAGLAAASAQASATRDAATIEAAARTAQQGIGSYGNLASAVVNSYGSVASQGIAGFSNTKNARIEADAAIEAERYRRGSNIGPALGAAVGLAGIFSA